MRSNPERIVSLVPSLTEALFALGLGPRLVGVTDWCVHPAAAVAHLPKVGGTKNPSLARVLELGPDLVIANREENRERDARNSDRRLSPAKPGVTRDSVAPCTEFPHANRNRPSPADAPVESSWTSARLALSSSSPPYPVSASRKSPGRFSATCP